MTYDDGRLDTKQKLEPFGIMSRHEDKNTTPKHWSDLPAYQDMTENEAKDMLYTVITFLTDTRRLAHDTYLQVPADTNKSRFEILDSVLENIESLHRMKDVVEQSIDFHFSNLEA